MPTLHQLEHLLALEETRHFAKAASSVHLSQPAFSRSIQALEKETGMILFERNSGEIRPTPAGTFMIERARQLVQDAKSMQRDLRLFQHGEAGELAFGVGPFPCATLAPVVVAHVRKNRPHVSMRIEVGNQEALLSLLLKEEIEFFVSDTREISHAPYLQIETVMKQFGHLYARTGHPLCDKPHLFKDAWEYGIASVKLPEEIKAGLENLHTTDSRTHSRLAVECDNTYLLHQLATRTDTVVASTEMAAQPWLETGELVKLNTLDFPSLFAHISIVSLRSRMLSPVAELAMEQFRISKKVQL